jgi:hypothetical protein
MPLRPENSPPAPGSPESLLTLEELLGLPNREVVSVVVVVVVVGRISA